MKGKRGMFMLHQRRILLCVCTILAFVILLCGCDRIANGSVQESEITVDAPGGNESIQFDKAKEEWEKNYSDKQLYPDLERAAVDIVEEEGCIIFNADVRYSFDREESIPFSEEMIRTFQVCVSNYNPNLDLAPPSDGYYGEIYDMYGVTVIVRPPDAIDVANTWYVYHNMEAGAHDPVLRMTESGQQVE